MSTSSVRRVKEQGSSNGKISSLKPSKSQTLISQKGIRGNVSDAFKKPTGKENPRPSSRGFVASSRKPLVKTVPSLCMSPPAVSALAKPRSGRSTPLVSRGTSSSPFDFSRMLSDLRKQKANTKGYADPFEKGMFGNIDQSKLSAGMGLSRPRVLDKLHPKGTLRETKPKQNNLSLNGGINCRRLPVKSVRISDREKGSELESQIMHNRKLVTDKKGIAYCGLEKSRPILSKASVNRDLSSDKEGCGYDYALKGHDGDVVNEECQDDSCFVLKQEFLVEKPSGIVDFDTEGLHENSLEKMKILDELEGMKLNDGGDSNGLRFSVEGGDLDFIGKNQKNVIVNEQCEEQSPFVLNADCTVENLAEGMYNESLDKLEVLGSKQNGLNDGVGAEGCNKYSSNLQEKLAFLEGKVKKIASDIKRTKVVLEMSNHNESRVVLSNIKGKIFGIGKTMCHALSSSDGALTDSVKIIENNDVQEKVVEMIQSKPSDSTGKMIKGMNSEELEARFFPHHKLLRGRTSLKPSSFLSHKSLSSDDTSVTFHSLGSISKEQESVVDSVLGICKIQERDGVATSEPQRASKPFIGEHGAEVDLMANETIHEFDNQGDTQEDMIIDDDGEDTPLYQLTEIGSKASTGGWFVSQGESVLLAHGDGSCSYYDIANCEKKAEYMPSSGLSPNIWRDCWIICAPGLDGCAGKYVVAASAGNTVDSGFCSWDFYTKIVQAFHVDGQLTPSRPALGRLPSNIDHRRNPSVTMCPATGQWWYHPCGPLIVSTATCQRDVRIYDIRDGEQIMNWKLQNLVMEMDYSSPLQWRNKKDVVIAESNAVTMYDVSSLSPQPVLSISSGGREICALHVGNTEYDFGGGVRQRVSSSEEEANDGVFCTPDSINVMDFRSPAGIGLKIPKAGMNAQSVFSRGDSIYIGSTLGKNQASSQIQHFSLRKRKVLGTYAFPQSNAHFRHASITQVWGDSNYVMGVSGLGLFLFDSLKGDSDKDHGNTRNVKEVIGPEDLYSPSFDYESSRSLLISRDRPAQWSYLW